MRFTHIIIVLFMTAANLSVAQNTPPQDPDTLSVPPGIVRVKAEIVSTEQNTAVIKVLEVVGYGSGIINVLASGQEVTVRLHDDNIDIQANQQFEADLREKMGADAALSTYTLLTAKKIEH